MISISPALQDLMSRDNAELFYCVAIKDVKLTTFRRDVTLPDGLYVSSELIAGVEAPVTSASVDRSLYKVVLADTDRLLANLYETSLIGAPLRVLAIFVNPVTGVPLLSDPFVVYSGVIQGFEQSAATETLGEVQTVVTGSNPLAALDATASFFCSRETLGEIDPTDTAFDQVYEDSGKVSIKWGKK